MKVYVVYNYYHYDDYKRAYSSSSVNGVFYDAEVAYKYALEKFQDMFDLYCKDYNICEKHVINQCWIGKKSYLLCENCCCSLIEDCTINLNDEVNFFSK